MTARAAFANFAVYSLYSLIGGIVPVYTWATLPINAPQNQIVAVTDTLNGGSDTWVFKGDPVADATYPWALLGGAYPPSYFDGQANVSGGDTWFYASQPTCVVPCAGVYDCLVAADAYSTGSGSGTMGAGVSASTGTSPDGSHSDTGTINAGARGDLHPSSSYSVTVAAVSGTIYLWCYAGFQGYYSQSMLGVRPLKVAGSA